MSYTIYDYEVSYTVILMKKSCNRNNQFNIEIGRILIKSEEYVRNMRNKWQSLRVWM